MLMKKITSITLGNIVISYERITVENNGICSGYDRGTIMHSCRTLWSEKLQSCVSGLTGDQFKFD